MPAKRRDSGRASTETNLPARKAPKGRLADRVTRSDFGVLQTRPSSPQKRSPAGTGQHTDSGAPDDVDLPPLRSTGGNKPR